MGVHLIKLALLEIVQQNLLLLGIAHLLKLLKLILLKDSKRLLVIHLLLLQVAELLLVLEGPDLLLLKVVKQRPAFHMLVLAVPLDEVNKLL